MGQIQVVTGVEGRRRWSDEKKRAIVAAAFAPGAVVSEGTRRADVCANLIYRWRRDLAAAAKGFAEVVVFPGEGGEPTKTPRSRARGAFFDLVAGAGFEPAAFRL